ncbi:MAG: ATP-dependent Clp protease proteolytic subunit [Desulfuromonas sp.]|nr:ATP-dependent Clp protease proteolytic subunit [Desulfuromonas sp.]
MIFSNSRSSDLLKRRNLVLFNIVDADSAKEIITQALFLASKSSEPITLNICSNGGEVPAGLAIVDALHATGCTIKTLCLGQACSMAAVLLAAGTKGERYISKHSRVLLHPVSGGCYGAAPDLQRQCQELQRSNELLAELLAEFTGKPVDQIKADIERDFWLGAVQAVKYGVADHILQEEEIV